MNHEDIELHDANLKRSTVDYLNQIVQLKIDYYPTEQSKKRITATFKFSGVSSYNENSSIKEIKEHAKFGNITSWAPADKSGTTYFYLARGFISITAKGLEIVNDVEESNKSVN